MNFKNLVFGIFVFCSFFSFAQKAEQKQYYVEKVDSFVVANNLSEKQAEELKSVLKEYKHKRKNLKTQESSTKEDWKKLNRERQAAIKAVLTDEEVYKQWRELQATEVKKAKKKKALKKQ